MTSTEAILTMPDQVPALTRDNIREEAGEIISAIDASRSYTGPFEANWRRLWQLVREAKAAFLPWDASNRGPWHLSGERAVRKGGLPSLSAGNFQVSIWPPDQAGLGGDLPGLLNWAGVPEPDAQ
jgi:hypothetical protein